MTNADPNSPADLSVNLAGMAMKNPVMTASGTSGYGPEYSPYLDIKTLGAFVTKAVTVAEGLTAGAHMLSERRVTIQIRNRNAEDNI